jgi:hypothetical protein
LSKAVLLCSDLYDGDGRVVGEGVRVKGGREGIWEVAIWGEDAEDVFQQE